MFSGGLKGQSQYVDLVSLSLNTYVYRQAHPALRRLNLNLALFIIQQLGDYLNPAVSVFLLDFSGFFWHCCLCLQLRDRTALRVERSQKQTLTDLQAVLRHVDGARICVSNQLEIRHDEEIQIWSVSLRQYLTKVFLGAWGTVFALLSDEENGEF